LFKTLCCFKHNNPVNNNWVLFDRIFNLVHQENYPLNNSQKMRVGYLFSFGKHKCVLPRKPSQVSSTKKFENSKNGVPVFKNSKRDSLQNNSIVKGKNGGERARRITLYNIIVLGSRHDDTRRLEFDFEFVHYRNSLTRYVVRNCQFSQ